jgi:hypothetical protein
MQFICNALLSIYMRGRMGEETQNIILLQPAFAVIELDIN